ncbi:Molybdopterin-synthase adenylyltransferase [Bacillus sp. THAF10]|uniref:ThiF family adenylyltransferase n=1 Tax=Bacillus sp. THAF10 TaxID=2587848 RepID=UPI00126839B0|nr:ThiF family adenylyltransferase [Bacillus sp. THAF10]QFT87896.1 Molybdopterin-synthase adenylyltransferase [Bacillus sp. THAF10]
MYKPKYNPIYSFRYISKNLLRLGNSPDKVVEIEDENGSIYMLLSLMDGNREISQIIDQVCLHYPDISEAEIKAAVEEFNNLGFLLHTDQNQHILGPNEQERFKGNVNYMSHFCPPNMDPSHFQKKISNAKITIIGMGAFGCSLLFNLAGLGVRNVRIIDFDTVDLSNLNRQMLFNEQDIGRLKIDAAQDFMSAFYSSMKIETINQKIDQYTLIEPLIEGSDLVILAADQPFLLLQRWVNEACVNKSIPFIAGGINITMGQFNTIIPGESGCIDCMHIHNFKETEDYAVIVHRVLEENFIPPNTATSPNLMMITGIIASEVFKFLTELEKPQSLGKLLRFDFMNYETTKIREWEIQDDCPTCGSLSSEHEVINLFQKEHYIKRDVVPR